MTEGICTCRGGKIDPMEMGAVVATLKEEVLALQPLHAELAHWRKTFAKVASIVQEQAEDEVLWSSFADADDLRIELRSLHSIIVAPSP